MGIEIRASDSSRMQQGFLFEPQTMAQAELRQAIERLDFAAASLKVEEFQRIWPASELAWEPDLIRIGSRLVFEHLDLDSGYSVWEKLESRLESFSVSKSYTRSMRRNFFSRLLAVNGRLFEEPRTPAGRPLGDFYLLAEEPDNARRYYEKQVRRVGDGWELRLRLGNCDFRLGHAGVARSNYHWAFVLGLPQDSWNLIEDTEFAARLRDAEDPEWAFPEVCTAGELPPPRFSTSEQFEEFKSRLVYALGEACEPRRFSIYWIISENKPFCRDNELINARIQMKALNSPLHAQYMQRLA
jgi:hypothetical protein